MIHVVPALLQRENQGFALNACLFPATLFSFLTATGRDFGLRWLETCHFWARVIHFVQHHGPEAHSCLGVVCPVAPGAGRGRSSSTDGLPAPCPATGSSIRLMASICFKPLNEVQQEKKNTHKKNNNRLLLGGMLEDHMN